MSSDIKKKEILRSLWSAFCNRTDNRDKIQDFSKYLNDLLKTNIDINNLLNLYRDSIILDHYISLTYCAKHNIYDCPYRQKYDGHKNITPRNSRLKCNVDVNLKNSCQELANHKCLFIPSVKAPTDFKDYSPFPDAPTYIHIVYELLLDPNHPIKKLPQYSKENIFPVSDYITANIINHWKQQPYIESNAFDSEKNMIEFLNITHLTELQFTNNEFEDTFFPAFFDVFFNTELAGCCLKFMHEKDHISSNSATVYAQILSLLKDLPDTYIKIYFATLLNDYFTSNPKYLSSLPEDMADDDLTQLHSKIFLKKIKKLDLDSFLLPWSKLVSHANELYDTLKDFTLYIRMFLLLFKFDSSTVFVKDNIYTICFDDITLFDNVMEERLNEYFNKKTDLPQEDITDFYIRQSDKLMLQNDNHIFFRQYLIDAFHESLHIDSYNYSLIYKYSKKLARPFLFEFYGCKETKSDYHFPFPSLLSYFDKENTKGKKE